MTSDKTNSTRLYLLRYDRGSRAHSKLIRQLKTLSRRIREGMPRFHAAMGDLDDRSGQWIVEGTSLRLDFECYIEVLSRFFRLCRDATGIEAIMEEPIVQQIRIVRNRIIEHGYEVNRDGDQNFLCDEHGPKLVRDGSQTECPAFLDLEPAVALVLDKYGITECEFQGRQMQIRGPLLWTENDSAILPTWP